jgi:hypothetical protein
MTGVSYILSLEQADSARHFQSSWARCMAPSYSKLDARP